MGHNPANTGEVYFYQTIDIPGVGLRKGDWDHRPTVESYLGHAKLNGKTVLDIGPANGFFTFEMEKRGASVTALDLGQSGDWDAVPNAKAPWSPESLKADLRASVQKVENAFWMAHKAFGSKAKMEYGTAYDAPKVVDKVDVALISNVLQHLRDPFLAIQRVSETVREMIIITETMWNDDKAFQAGTMMEFLPRAEPPGIFQSWWHVPEGLVIEILKLLGYEEIRCIHHDEQFNGTLLDPKPRKVPHYTVTGIRTGYTLRFTSGWHQGESKTSKKWNGEIEKFSWRWASEQKASIQIEVANGKEGRTDIRLKIACREPDKITVSLNGSEVATLVCTKAAANHHLENLVLKAGTNILELESSLPPSPGSGDDPRNLGFKFFDSLHITRL